MKKIVVVTGANRGIGFYVCKNLGNEEYTILMTSRSQESGELAQKKLKDEFNIEVTPFVLDISSDQSVAEFFSKVKEEYGRIDVLINNAGVSHASSGGESFREKTTYEVAERNVTTNYFGTFRFTEKMIPLLRKSQSPRLIFVSSMGGIMVAKNMSEELRKEYFSSCQTRKDIESMMGRFLEHVKNQDYYQNGYDEQYPYLSYGISKLATNLYMRILSKEFKDEIFVVALHPGHVATRMTTLSPYQKLTPDAGGKRVVWLCSCDREKYHGVFVSDGNIISIDYK